MRRAIVAMLLVSATAGAEPPGKPHKALRAALGWSLGVTAFGVATGIAATHADRGAQFALLGFSGTSLLVGPSIGRFYAGHYVSAGLVTRVIGLGVFSMGQALQCLPQNERSISTCGARLQFDGTAYVGAGIMVLGAMWDLASIPEDVADYNSHATLIPTALRTPTGIAPGLALVGQF
jgi:hypothetical protein